MTKPTVAFLNFANVFEKDVERSSLPVEGTAGTGVLQLPFNRISFSLQHATALFCNNSPCTSGGIQINFYSFV